MLENIRSQVGNRWPQVVAELRSYGDQDLRTFLNESGLDLSDVLRNGHSWTELRRSAGLPTRSGSNLEEALLKRMRAFAHVDDSERLMTYGRLLADDPPSYAELSPLSSGLARMLFFSLWPGGSNHETINFGLAQLRREEALRDEIRAIIDVSSDAARHVTVGLEASLRHLPLQVYGRYQREEVLAALDYASLDRKPNSFREGVLHVPALNVDAFFVTLQKSEEDFSPTTLYRDYPISPTLFHWESQSTTSVASATGQRYLNGPSMKLLFVRKQKSYDLGTSPYLFTGPVHYVQHAGDRPIAFVWRLDNALPSEFFAAASVAAS